MIPARFICLIGGYIIGLFQTAYIYGKMHGIDIREHGSGNAGTTNALRVLGKKAGLIVFLGDFLKGFLTCLIVRLVINNFYPDEMYLFVAYGALGVVLGHNFPFYMHFKGGKGIAATGGAILGFLDPIMIIACALAFFVIVPVCRYVSVGSILLVLTFAVTYTVRALSGHYPFNLDDPVSKEAMIESVIVVCFMAGMAIYRHKANIVRLIHHEENKLF